MESSRARALAARWQDLSGDILLFISEKLPSTWDLIRFRGVCSSWRSCMGSGYRLPPQVPSLLLPYYRESDARSFLDVSTRRVITMNLPEARGKWVYGTAYGWLVMLGAEPIRDFLFSVSLVNPITRSQILLPSLPRNIVRWKGSLQDILESPEKELVLRYGERTRAFSTKPLLTGSPASSQGSSEVFIALVIFSELVFCRLGAGEAWSVVELRIPGAPGRIMAEFTYFDGAFYVVDNCKGLTVVKTTSSMERYSVPPNTRMIPHNHRLHLVEVAGDLFLLQLPKVTPAASVEVEKLNMRGKKVDWVKVKDNMSGCSLFVSHIHSSISSCPSYITVGGRGIIVFTTEDVTFEPFRNIKDLTHGTGMHTAESTVYVRIWDMDSGTSDGRDRFYWRSSSRPYIYRGCMSGLSWIIPNPC